MITVSFNTDKIPRTMTRREWCECHRWLRRCQREIENHMTDLPIGWDIFGRVIV